MANEPCSWGDIPHDCCPDWDDLDPAVQAASDAYASTILWAATGRRFGLCTVTVRPCGRYRECGSDNWWWNGGWWLPYIDSSGGWRNCWCGCSCCTCQPACQVQLPGPVASVTEVMQDGVVVPSGSYRVDDGQWLVRTDGLCWPDCQDFDVDSGPGTFSVTYQRGETVPVALLTAAGALACEWSKACSGGPCRLPGRISSVARTGVEVSMIDPTQILQAGLTGLIEVDQAIMAYNPGRLVARPRVWTPDIGQPRTVTST